MPVEPAPTAWAFPRVEEADGDGLVGIGADLEAGTILAAYRRGLFPMPVGRRGTLGWWSPDPRAVIPLDRLHVSRSLRRSRRRFEVRVDTAFDAVIEACADPARPHGWISPEVRSAYTRLHELGWVHSVEAWDRNDGELAGGLYGVAIGGLFAGESMFHRRTDASKVALVGLVDLLRDGRGGQESPVDRLLDVQWMTDHLAQLGAVEVARDDYLEMVRRAVDRPLPAAFAGSRAH
ncbi:MAG TPA: leucyl/phenylalanyl-tRNA--protein transferase [Acidimicrobiales bacterium]|nr:leucyl/phenylalanyl-tRNA--protein transferase [Acidimicrobiales bacterium]